jgi:phosphoglycerate kinase
LSAYRTIDDLDVAGKRVLVRVDFNVPAKDGVVTDATRIERALPAIEELSKKGAKVILLSHYGRPGGKREEKDSLRPVAKKLVELLRRDVAFADDCVGEAAAKVAGAMKPGDVAMFENTRFHKGEEKNDPDFVKALAANGDLYVNDAFSAAHRAHASTEGLAHLLPAAAGRAMEKELDYLAAALSNPQRPLIAIVGGAKVSTKIEVLTNLVSRMDVLAVGGGMANTFLLAQGMQIGGSFAEPDFVATAKEIMAGAKASGCEIVLPTDAVVAKELKAGVDWQVCPIGEMPQDAMILDLGPKSIADLRRRLASVRTVLWNGPLGAFETPPFGEGTFAVAKEVARLTKEGKLISVAGGGDTVRALNEADVADDLSYASTAGGAFLEWLGGAQLPGVLALARSGARSCHE